MSEANRSEPPSDPAGRRGWWKKGILLAVVLLAAGILYWFFGERLSLENLARHEESLVAFGRQRPVLVVGAAFGLYVLVTAFSLPLAAVSTLAIAWLCGQVFGGVAGFLIAAVLVSFASTSGATLAFLFSRYLFRDVIRRRFGDRLAGIEAAFRREGAFYLFTLRLIPQMPFFVINVLMGLTPLRTRTFWWVSQLGMLPGTCVYVYAGTTIPSLNRFAEEGVRGILSTPLAVAFILLGLFPIAVRKIMQRLRPQSVPDDAS